MMMDFKDVIPQMPFILEGLKVTLSIVVVSLFLGFILGILLTLCKISVFKPLIWLADFYTSIFRGTPLVLQLLIIYFGLPQLLGFQIDQYWAAVAAFSLNSAAYVSEIIRAGINAIDKGQKEAAVALGIPYAKMMKDLLLPQAFKNISPALVNETITLTKESAIVTVIGLGDVMRRAYQAGAVTYNYLEPLIFAGLIYYVIVLILTFVGKSVERKLKSND
ncbi:amino acid ABC transporter permease [Bacillus altitudinis MN12]|uniref:Amino acid ABC transporter permease n=7 Tax=Bacillus TaxID=1386 RepID=A0ABV1S416_BACAB|nr:MULTISPECIES: amino acid ABC transporter permease [Bacillus]AHL71999.1 arginine ABC transporter permease [Bacillus pumilus]KML00188.1 arginine ABC transporter permease [Bacillus stratosphericus]MBR0582956.1 amino acid ABC transporter permease [Bacillus altitudinis MN12]MBR0592868.1 amino acid ABC transporter permease [Bacillus altitudinis C16B11]MBR0627540.1 amino acid ABC transporter permease [Bacillus altitudinis S70-5-12]MBR0631079.1 amino acid ABC transporter permease [Bacillus altitud